MRGLKVKTASLSPERLTMGARARLANTTGCLLKLSLGRLPGGLAQACGQMIQPKKRSSTAENGARKGRAALQSFRLLAGCE